MWKARAVCWCVILSCGLGLAQESSVKPSPPAVTSMPTSPDAGRKGSKDQHIKKKGHSVELKWSPSSTKDIAGYFVFRAKGGADGKYVQITKRPIAETQYTDHHVKAGKTYAYQISAVAKSGNPPLQSARTPPEVVTVPRH